MRSPVALFFALVFLTGCASGAQSGSAAAASPTPLPATHVPEGYHGTAWGTSREVIAKSDPALAPSKTHPHVLVKPTTANGMAGTEAFFFDASDALEEVELRITPKQSAAAAAKLAVGMDQSMGPHEVALADDNAYQFVWSGEGTEVRLSYDLRESVAFGPVVSWAKVKPGASPSGTPSAAHATKSATPIPSATLSPANPGGCFVTAVKGFRDGGMHLTQVESVRGRLTLVYETAGSAREVTLSADPKTGALTGCGSGARAAPNASLQFRAEGAIDTEIRKAEPVSIKWGGPAAVADLVTISFKSGAWIALRPETGDSLAGHGSR